MEIKAAIEAKIYAANDSHALSNIASRQAEKLLRDPVYEVSASYLKAAMEAKLRDAEKAMK